MIAVDKMGICPLTWTLRRGELLFSSKLDALLAHPSTRADIDPQSIFDYCYFHVIPGPRTIYRGVSRLLPGHALHFRDGKVEIYRHFTPEFDETIRRPQVELAREFKEILVRSIDRARGPGPTGTFLSGGTDSSTVTGLLSRASNRPVDAFSIGFSVAEYDEMHYARIAARHFNVNHHEYSVTPEDVESAIPLIATAFDQPFGNASAVPAYFCGRMAREHGITRMLAGDGGDELFGGNSRYAVQKAFEVYHRLPHTLRRSVLEPAASNIALFRTLPGLRQLGGYVRHARPDLPDRLNAFNLLQFVGIDDLLDPTLRARIDPAAPLARQRDVWAHSSARSLVNRMLEYD